jgi:hypothetical protein
MRHAILQADRNRDREIVHQAPHGHALLVHVDEDLAEPAVRILAGPEIDLVAADAGLLGVALSASGKRFPHDETCEAREGRFVGENGVRLARLFDRFHCRLLRDPYWPHRLRSSAGERQARALSRSRELLAPGL